MAVCGKLIFRFLCSHPGAPPLGLILASSPLRSQRCPEPGSLESNWPHLEVGGDLETARSGATLCPLLPALGFGAWACLGSLDDPAAGCGSRPTEESPHARCSSP